MNEYSEYLEVEYEYLKRNNPMHTSLMYVLRKKMVDSLKDGPWETYVFWRTKYDRVRDICVRNVTNGMLF